MRDNSATDNTQAEIARLKDMLKDMNGKHDKVTKGPRFPRDQKQEIYGLALEGDEKAFAQIKDCEGGLSVSSFRHYAYNRLDELEPQKKFSNLRDTQRSPSNRGIAR